jgi:hypothetical protein
MPSGINWPVVTAAFSIALDDRVRLIAFDSAARAGPSMVLVERFARFVRDERRLSRLVSRCRK